MIKSRSAITDLLRLIFSIVISFMLLWQSQVLADTLRVTANHLPPYMIISNDPEKPRYSGFEYDLTHLLADKLGLDVYFVECGWAGCVDALEKGHIDIVHSLLYTEVRNRYLEYLQPAYIRGEYTTVFYQRFDDPRVIESFNDMVEQEMVVGYLGSTVYFPQFENTEKLIKVDVKNIDIGLKLLASNRIDTLAGFEELLNEIEENHPNWLRILKHGTYHPTATMQSYTAISRKSPRYHLKTPMQNALKALTDNGEIQRLKHKWIKTIKEK
ncbi:MAG: substrate-binding periplasmic protein [Aestuariibacter sp.]